MIFDCFTFFNEFRILELRLAELSETVDRFVLVEADRTFQGDPKPFWFDERKSELARYLPKIIHVKLVFPDDVGLHPIDQRVIGWREDANWRREFYQRNAIARGIADAAPRDLVIVSDVDEIPRAASLREAIGSRRPGELTIFEMPLLNFCVDREAQVRHRRARDLRWLGPRMAERRCFGTINRMKTARPFVSPAWRGSLLGEWHTRLYNLVNYQVRGYPRIAMDSGWHFSTTGGWETFRQKAEAYSHPEAKDEDLYRSPDAVIAYLRDNCTPYPEECLPAFVRANRSRFPFFEDLQRSSRASA